MLAANSAAKAGDNSTPVTHLAPRADNNREIAPVPAPNSSTDAPCAICQVKLFGGSATEEDYAALTEALTDILREELDIDSDRIYVTYEEIGFWGWNGGNL